METINSILKLIYPSCFMASIDLKDAYYAVKVHDSHQKYLKFQFKGRLYQFTCLPNGLCTGPRKFTKITKPPLAFLRTQGHIISSYIDDMINVGDTFLECQQNVCDTLNLFLRLGFNINHQKSALEPKQIITFLGFIIDSRRMKISPTSENKEKVKKLATELIQSNAFTIRFLAKVIGTFISTFPGVKDGPLHFRQLEDGKSTSLKLHTGTSHTVICNCETQQIWKIAIRHNIHISATHIPGKQNEEADFQSRKQELRTEWKLAKDAFHNALKHFNITPQIDLLSIILLN